MRKKYYLLGAIIAGITAFTVLSITLAGAAGQALTPVNMATGDTVTINCKGGKVEVVSNANGTASLKCTGGPVINNLTGVTAGGTISGKVNIEAKVSAGSSAVSLVIFDLFSGSNRIDTRNEAAAPYFYYGDNNGQPYGWDTTKLKDGAYSLLVTAKDAAGLTSNLRVSFNIKNASVSPTPSPTPTPTMPPHTSEKGVCGESMDVWHPPVVTGPDGKPCNTGHEHGDAPPSWITAAGYMPMFHGHFNTSAIENTTKHAAMKGFIARFSNVDLYFRVHAASNPLDRMARYHSYEVWARDPSGGVSHWQGWYNSGDPVTDRIVRRSGVESSVRPVMLVVDETSAAQGINCEQWYGFTSEWSWDFGWTICGATTYYTPGENATATDQSTWKPTGSLGGTRRLEAAWYINRAHPTGKFYATQFGELVSGPSDARCTATTTKFGTTYQNICLDQYIAPTMQQVAFPNNAVQKTFDTTGVKLPN